MCSLSCNASVPDYTNCICVIVPGCEVYQALTDNFTNLTALVATLENPSADYIQQLTILQAQIDALALYCVDNNGNINTTYVNATFQYILQITSNLQIVVGTYISTFNPVLKTTIIATTPMPTTLPPCTLNCTQSNPNVHCPANRFDNLFSKSFTIN